MFQRKKEREKTKMEQRTKRTNNKNKMFVVRKRQVAALSLILLIGIAGYLNLSLKSEKTDPSVSVMYSEASKKLGEAKMVNSTQEEAQEKDDGKNNTQSVTADYFANARLERETKRGEAIEILKEILNSTESDKEAKENAQARITQLANFTEGETQAENLIRAKGYGDCVVYMGENTTSVAVSTNGLNEIDAAVITDIVANSGNIPADEVKIVEIKPN